MTESARIAVLDDGFGRLVPKCVVLARESVVSDRRVHKNGPG
jgi:hypothetical protein